MALASCRARQGQQRSLRRSRQALSWAFALSPGERGFACALLASFWEAGLFFPLYGILAYVLPWEPLSARGTRPAASSSARTPQILSAFLSCTEPGSAPDTHRMSPPGLAMTCRFIPCLLCLPE